jgi:hypothetical protein
MVFEHHFDGQMQKYNDSWKCVTAYLCVYPWRLVTELATRFLTLCPENLSLCPRQS